MNAQVIALATPGRLSSRFAPAGIPVDYWGLVRVWQLPGTLWKRVQMARRPRPDIVYGCLSLPGGGTGLMGDADLRERFAEPAVVTRERFSMERIAGMWEGLFEKIVKWQ